jgi:hypothetical protein
MTDDMKKSEYEKAFGVPDNPPPSPEDLVSETERQARDDAREIFSTDAGRRYLDYLKARYLDVPVCHACADIFCDIPNAYMREGQNTVIRGILDHLRLPEEINQPTTERN